MAFDGLLIHEIFHSLQGETSLAGIPFAFIRLTGCNLRCAYCDTAYAFKGGRKMGIEQILGQIKPLQVKHVLLTGGEPLMQRHTPELARRLHDQGYVVSIETHGETSIEAVSSFARVVMDIKTPSSGMCRGGFERNLPFLKSKDEIKFVIASRADYEWAKNWVLSKKLPTREVLFSAAQPAPGAPAPFEGVTATWLAESILKDHLPVRLQMQLHKLLWGIDRRGV